MISLQDIPEWRRAFDEVGDQDAATVAEHVLRQVDEREERSRQRLQGGAETKQRLRELVAFFDANEVPPRDFQIWPHDGLRAMAMLAPIHVAQGLFGVDAATLERAIRSNHPNRSWTWWRALGEALLTQLPSAQIQEALGLTPRAVQKYRRFLLGPANHEEVAA